MKRRLILLVATICVFLVTFLIWRSHSESNDFSSMEGEIMIMQQMKPTETPMYKFNLQTDALLPFHNNFFEPRYSVNNGNKLLAVIQIGFFLPHKMNKSLRTLCRSILRIIN
ncbi:hypothetical protein AZ66_01520 [Paenibacillus sp. E194]|nr:hypothetical protein AZ66_01520 [Paenibacillus sp. E194]